MKKLIYLMMILMVPFAFGYNAGSSELIYSISNCDRLDVVVNGSYNIDYEEYNFSNCVENNNTWSCNCDGSNFDLIINTKPNTINNYTILLNYDYWNIIKSSGGHSKSIIVMPDNTIIENNNTNNMTNKTSIIDSLMENYFKKIHEQKIKVYNETKINTTWGYPDYKFRMPINCSEIYDNGEKTLWLIGGEKGIIINNHTIKLMAICNEPQQYLYYNNESDIIMTNSSGIVYSEIINDSNVIEPPVVKQSSFKKIFNWFINLFKGWFD